jgi:hypothetical protein
VTIIRLTHDIKPFVVITLHVAQGYGLLKALTRARKSSTPYSVEELAIETTIPDGVVLALLDFLSSQFICEEIEPEKYIGTQMSERFDTEAMETSFAIL